MKRFAGTAPYGEARSEGETPGFPAFCYFPDAADDCVMAA